MKLISRILAPIVAGAMLGLPTLVSATNGYFMIGYGAVSRGMGGVGVALPQGGMASAFNPAAMTFVPVQTMQVDGGAEFFLPPRAAQQDSALLESGFPGADGPVNHKSGANVYLIPSMGGVYKFNRKLTIGMSAIGNGAGSRYDQTIPGNPGCMDGNQSGQLGSSFFNVNCLGGPTAGVNLIQMQMLPSVSYKINRNQAVGMSLAIGVQTFRAFGLQAFDFLGFSAGGTGNLTNRGNDWAYGAGVRFGWMGRFFDERLSLGANYASRVYMTKFDKYRNLFAEQGGFDIPEHFAVGLAYAVTKDITVAFDVQHIRYASVNSVGNPGPTPADPNNFFPPGYTFLGADNGLGFGWQNVTAYKLGIDYRLNSTWSVRAGANYAKTPIQEDQVLFNMLAPATPEWHATFGLTYRSSPNLEFTFNYVHAFKNVIKGPTAFGPVSGAVVQGSNASIAMEQNMLGFALAYKL